MKLSELLFLGALAVFAGVALYGGLGMPFTSGVTFGPGFLPVLMAASIFVIVGLIVLRGISRPAPRGDAPAGDGAPSVVPVIVAVALIAATLVAAALGSLLVPLGICMMVVTAVLLNRSWVVAAISTALTLAAIYAIFALWLHIPIT